jgi:hypothetical protein
MAKSKFGSGGGGVNTRQHVRTPIKAGPPNTKKISHSAAANIGIKKGDHATGQGKPLNRPADPLIQKQVPQVKMGNAAALEVGRGGPGAGRVVHGCGTQGMQGRANPGIAPQLTPGGGPGGMGFSGKGK